MLTLKNTHVGNILEYYTSNGWEEKIIDDHDIQSLSEDDFFFNKIYRPIPLTPEFLDRIEGFEKVQEQGENHSFYHLHSELELRFRGNEIYVYYNEVLLNTVTVEHLHDLQNLLQVFGKELEVKG